MTSIPSDSPPPRSLLATLRAFARRCNDLAIFDAARWPYREWVGRIVATVAVSAFFFRRVTQFPAHVAATDQLSASLVSLGASASQVRWVEWLRHLQWGFEVAILVVYVVAFLFRRNARGVARGFMEVVFPFLVSAMPLVIALSPWNLGRFVPTTSSGYTAALLVILAIMTFGAAVNFAGLWTLRRAFTIMTEARELVTGGLFRWVRHPLYLGHFIAFFGVLLAHVHVWTVCLYVVFVLAQVLRARFEERKLEATFPEYGAYRRTTGMFFPRLGRGARAGGVVLLLAWGGSAPAGALSAERFQLDNGMTFLLVHRPELTTVAAGWVAQVGSAAETPGQTGLAHYLEHALFHGSQTIGTRDFAAEAPLLAEEDTLRARLADGDDPAARARLAEVTAALAALAVPNEFDTAYTRVGGADLNAFTTEDFTASVVRLPAERLELWFWLESDRLAAPVFRRFEAEREVIRAERRQRLAGDPRVPALENALAAAWPDHPYGWPPMGREEDHDALTRTAAKEFFTRWYRPERLTAVLVGPFDRLQVEALARRYFGRLPRGEATPVGAFPAPPAGERRTAISWPGPPTVHLEHHTVPFDAPDAAALDLLAAVISSRSGSFHRRLVTPEGARSLRANHNSRRWGGGFQVDLEARELAAFDALEAAWAKELERFVREGVEPAELERVQKQLRLESYRRVEDPYRLAAEMLIAAGRGHWRRVFDAPAVYRTLGSADLQQVARRYLAAERRLVARWVPQGAP